MEHEIHQLLALSVIRPSDASVPPIVLVKKGDSFRMYIDYTQLNDYTLWVAYPLPSILAITTEKFFRKLG